jgi:hypothetical protein
MELRERSASFKHIIPGFAFVRSIRHIWVAAFCSLALIGCEVAADRQRMAFERWQTQPVAHYRLVTDELVNSYSCAQAVEVRDEQIVMIDSNNCLQPSLWTVDWLFRRADKAGQAFDGCALSVPGVGCVCRDAVEAQVEYDPARGFPRSIIIHHTWAAAWQRPGYWFYAARYMALPNCTPSLSSSVWAVRVRELRPLP